MRSLLTGYVSHAAKGPG